MTLFDIEVDEKIGTVVFYIENKEYKLQHKNYNSINPFLNRKLKFERKLERSLDYLRKLWSELVDNGFEVYVEEIGLKITHTHILARSRKLNFKWTIEPEQQLEAYIGI